MRRALCFAAGLMLALSALLGTVALTATRPAAFEQALLGTVDAPALGMTQDDLRAFAGETMRYLRGEKPDWAPALPFAVPEAFSAHMAEVRSWVRGAALWLPLSAALALGLLLLGGRQRRACFAGVGAALALLAALLLWAAVDFDSLWMLLHRAFIPGGIFPAGEPVMRLFPLSLFFCYIGPVCLWAAGALAAVCGLLLELTRKGRTV